MNGYETYIKAAIQKKKLPLVIVEQSATKPILKFLVLPRARRAGTAKKVIMLNWHSTEQASVRVTNLKSSDVVFAYSVHKASSAHGKQSSAEACAKHIKDAIETSQQ